MLLRAGFESLKIHRTSGLFCFAPQFEVVSSS